MVFWSNFSQIIVIRRDYRYFVPCGEKPVNTSINLCGNTVSARISNRANDDTHRL